MSYGQVKMPQISWNMDYTKVTYKGEILEISALRRGIKQAIADVWKLMEAFTLGNRLVVSIPDDICCDKNNSTWGNTWVKPHFTTPQMLPLIFEMEHYKTWSLSTVDPTTGHIGWNIAQCRVFMDKMKGIIRLLGFLNYLVPGPPGRGTELILDRIYNTQVKRNFYMDFGWMLIARRYSKTSSITGRDNLIVAFMPKQLSEVNQYYQIFFRPVEQLVAAQLYPTQEVSLYHEFMYVLGGNRWTPDQFRAYIPLMSVKYFGSNLKVSYLRHMLIAIKRAFIPPMLTDIFQDIGDRMSAHSTEISNAWYAVEDALEGKTTTFMSDTRDWCRQYHNVLGVGESEDIPIPIRFLARPPAKPAASVGSVFLPTNDEIAKLQQVIIHMFTVTAQELKLQLTQEMQEAIYTSISRTTTSLQISNPLLSPPSIPTAHNLPNEPSTFSAINLTPYTPPISRVPYLVQQQPRTAFGDISSLTPESPSLETYTPPLPSPLSPLPGSSSPLPGSSSPLPGPSSPLSSGTQRGRSQQRYHHNISQNISQDSSSGSRKRKISPDLYALNQETQERAPILANEQGVQLPGIPLQAISGLSIDSPLGAGTKQGDLAG
jgi:hypothetical protein